MNEVAIQGMAIRRAQWLYHGIPCADCHGAGVKMYGNTATWRSRPGVLAGQAMTYDVCNTCWGSGRDDVRWPSHDVPRG